MEGNLDRNLEQNLEKIGNKIGNKIWTADEELELSGHFEVSTIICSEIIISIVSLRDMDSNSRYEGKFDLIFLHSPDSFILHHRTCFL